MSSRAAPLLTLWASIACVEPEPGTATLLDPSDDLTQRWRQTCNPDGPQPGLCPTGSECVVTELVEIVDATDGLQPPQAWCRASADAEQLLVELLPRPPGTTERVVIQLTDPAGAPLTGELGEVTLTATEGDLHRVESAEVRPDGTTELQLEQGLWHISLDKPDRLGASASLTALNEVVPWGAPDTWVKVDGPGVVDVPIASARIRFHIDSDFPEDVRVKLISDGATFSFIPTLVGDTFETPPLGPGPWRAENARNLWEAHGEEAVLEPGSTLNARFPLARREVTVLTSTEYVDRLALMSYDLAFGDSGTDIYDGINIRDEERYPPPEVSVPFESADTVLVPHGRWKVWLSTSTYRDTGQPNGWLRLGDDVELPHTMSLQLPYERAAVYVRWNDQAQDRDPILLKSFPDGSWSESPLSTGTGWPGEGTWWIIGNCSDYEAGPIHLLGASVSGSTPITYDVPVVKVRFRNAEGSSSAAGRIIRINPEDGQAYRPATFSPRSSGRRSSPSYCQFSPDSELTIFPGRYQIEVEGAAWVQDIDTSTELEVWSQPTGSFAFLFNGEAAPDVSSSNRYGVLRFKPIDSFGEDKFRFDTVGPPVVRASFWGRGHVNLICDSSTGCTQPLLAPSTSIGGPMILTRVRPP